MLFKQNYQKIKRCNDILEFIMKRSRFPFALALLLAVPFSLSACEGNKGVESSKDNQSSQEVSSRQESSHQESS